MKQYLMGLALAAVASVGCGFDNTPVSPAGTAGTGGPAGTGPAGTNGGAGATGAGGAGTGGNPDGAAGTTGAAGMDGGAPDGGGDPNMPMLLSQTGLYSDVKMKKLATGVYPFQPTYGLWSDSASKGRWVYMPPGGKIQTDDKMSIANMDFWLYPKGFKLWKEFQRDNKVIETRLIMKTGDGPNEWFMVAYEWNADYSDATALPEGKMGARQTQHDIPSKEACGTCHGSGAMFDSVLGFSALQLSHAPLTVDPNELTLDKIAAMGWLSTVPTVKPDIPGDATDKAALGYLHSNCGMCHNERGKPYQTGPTLDLWTHVNMPAATMQTTTAYLSMVCDQWPGPNGKNDKFAPITKCDAGHATGAKNEGSISMVMKRVVPKATAMSSIHELMNLRDMGGADMRQMPPLATKIVDPVGLTAIAAWINKLTP